MSLEQLSWYIDNTVAKRLLGVEGIAAVTREGGVDRKIRVILDPAALQAQGITAAQVNQQLRQTNLNAAGGRAEIAGSEQSVRVLGNAQDAYRACRRPTSSLPGGRLVKLADLGEVKDSYSEQRTIAKMNGRQVISFNVQRSKGSSEVTAYDVGWKELQEAREGGSARSTSRRSFNTGRLHQGAVHIGDGRADRRRDPGGARRLPVPPRHPRDLRSPRSPSRCRRSPPSGS